MDAEDLKFKPANVDLNLKVGRGSNFNTFVSSLINKLKRGRKNKVGGYTFKIQDPNKKTVGYMMISVAKKEEDLYQHGIKQVECKKCNTQMTFTCYGRDHEPIYHCPDCGLMVFADSLEKYQGRTIDIKDL